MPKGIGFLKTYSCELTLQQYPTPRNWKEHDGRINEHLRDFDSTVIYFISSGQLGNSILKIQINDKSVQTDANIHIVEDVLIRHFKPPWNWEGVRM